MLFMEGCFHRRKESKKEIQFFLILQFRLSLYLRIQTPVSLLGQNVI